jgi:hypothetical protein
MLTYPRTETRRIVYSLEHRARSEWTSVDEFCAEQKIDYATMSALMKLKLEDGRMSDLEFQELDGHKYCASASVAAPFRSMITRDIRRASQNKE